MIESDENGGDMISNGKILAEIVALRAAVQEFKRIVDVQSALIVGLRQDNRDMLNRLMVRDMKEYSMVSPASVAEMHFPAEKLAHQDEFSREFLAGEIADNET